ncbi:MAG: protein kinase [Bacteroidota bacterium]
MIGEVISHYKILEKLGAGGMGIVYKTQDLKLDRFVALKFLPPSFSNDEEAKQRFIHEAKSASALDHTNICTIHEIGETDENQLFIVMSFYEGETLKKNIEKDSITIEDAVDFAIQIAEGLARAHKKGIVHRDIKPANIFITKDGTVKILDFGLAKSASRNTMTQLGSTMGTVAYMSPEQTRGEKIDHRTDIWSLGVILYEMITGQLPFKGDYEQAIIYSILNENPEPILNYRSDLPKKLSPIIEKAIFKEPENRYQTIEELVSDLKDFDSEQFTFPNVGIAKKLLKHSQMKILFPFTALIVFAVLFYLVTYPFGSDTQRIKSLVVLPFENYTGSNELEYFVSGMHASLIGEIGKISALRVISKTTSNSFKNTEKSISDIASELNVDAAIETSVMGLGDSVNIQIKLVSGFPEERQLWNQNYIDEKSQILNLYNKVTKEISKEINVILTPEEKNLLAESRKIDPDAYDAYMKGQFLNDRMGNEDLNKAIEYFKIAIEKEPRWALPYAGLSHSWSRLMQSSRIQPTVALPKIYANLNKALELDPNFANLHQILAGLAVWMEWDWEKGEKEFKKALELNPNDAMSRISYAHFLIIMKRPDEARYHANLALELDPLKPFLLGYYARVMIWLNDCRSALMQAKKALSIDPENHSVKGALTSAYICLGDTVNWFEAWKTRAWWNDSTLAVIDEVFYNFGFHTAIEKIIEVNEEAEKKIHISMWGQARRYLYINDYDRAMDCLERAYDIHDPNIPNVGIFADQYEGLRKNTRYISLIQKLKLPLN